MRLATLKTAQITTAARVDSDGIATPIAGFKDIGALLLESNWEIIAEEADAEPIEFAPHDLAPVIAHPGKIICVGLNYAKPVSYTHLTLPTTPYV